MTWFLAGAVVAFLWLVRDYRQLNAKETRAIDRIFHELTERERENVARIARMNITMADEWSVDAAKEIDPLHRARWDTVENLLGRTISDE